MTEYVKSLQVVCTRGARLHGCTQPPTHPMEAISPAETVDSLHSDLILSIHLLM